MKTLENLILGDWGPTMRGIAWALGHAVAIPAAVLIVFAQWLAFTWRRPLAGVLALVPARKPDPVNAINESMAALAGYRQAEIEVDEFIGEMLSEVAAVFGLTADELTRIDFAPSTPNLTSTAPNLAASSPNLANDGPPARVISPALDAALDQVIGLKRPARPVGPDGMLLAPTPPGGGGAARMLGSVDFTVGPFILGSGGGGGSGATAPASTPQAEPPAPLPPALAPGPRRQRRRSNRPQSFA